MSIETRDAERDERETAPDDEAILIEDTEGDGELAQLALDGDDEEEDDDDDDGDDDDDDEDGEDDDDDDDKEEDE